MTKKEKILVISLKKNVTFERARYVLDKEGTVTFGAKN